MLLKTEGEIEIKEREIERNDDNKERDSDMSVCQ